MSESFSQSEQLRESNPLPPGQQLVGPGKWPFVGEREPLRSANPWTLSVSGLVDRPMTISIEQLSEFPQSELVTDIHCVTRWSKLDTRFSGVALETILNRCKVHDSARFISFVARSERSHSSSLPIDEAIKLKTLLATHYEGQLLPTDHGGPLRGVVPRKYFYKSVKWIERIEILAEDCPGYWEAETGYHNAADPWKEQRYIAASISKREAATLIDSRNFASQDLRSIDVGSLDLSNLNARDALLRNANFDGCNLTAANFERANLSNANFRTANLHLANFLNADLEGADFAGADLRGADLRGCSLFGTSFCDAFDHGQSIDQAAKLDRQTKIDPQSLNALTEPQKHFLQRFLDSL